MNIDLLASNDLDKLPRYARVAAQLREQMRSGAIKPGQRLPSFPEMKARQGVSQATMERAHAILEREGLIVRRRGVGTFVAEVLESDISGDTSRRTFIPKRSATGLLGFVSNLRPEGQELGRSVFWTQIVQGMTSAVGEAGQNLVLVDERESTDIFDKLDGAVTTTTDSQWVRQFRDRVRPGLPWVSLLAPIEGVISVTTDERAGIRAAIDHLLELGHRRIAYLIGRPNYFTQTRLAAYQEALLQAGIEPQLRWVRHMRVNTPESEFVAAPRERMTEWLNEDWADLGCTALLAQNDQAAHGIIEVLRAAGLRVPEDVSVVGFDGVDADETARLTTLAVPLREVGRFGVELLLRQLHDDPTLKSVELPVRLVVGQSTAPPPIAPPLT